MIERMHLPHIVVLGAGYGGLATVRGLVRRLEEHEATVTLIDQHPYHTLITQLHEPAAGTADPALTRIPLAEFSSSFATQRIRWQCSRVERINTQERRVYFSEQEEPLDYQYLVVGLGSVPQTFGIPGLLEHAFFIRDLEGVCRLRDHVEICFAGYKEDPCSERVTMVVGGAGFTGIEYLGELVDRVPELCRSYGVPQSAVRIVNVEAAPGALPGFSPDLVERAVQYLSKHGVTFRFRTAIASCSPTGVTLANGEELLARTVVWTGGVSGSPLLPAAGFSLERGRVPVDACLQPHNAKDMFVVGDCSLVKEGETFHPPTAQLAMQQGGHVARNLTALLRDQPLTPFEYHHKGTIASLGRREAVGVVGRCKLRGKLATWLKRFAFYRWLYVIGGLRIAWRYGFRADMKGRKQSP